MHSMTGYSNREAEIKPFGKVSIELRSSNHKFFETVFHLPEGFMSLEDKIKKEIETQVKRGRITCIVSVSGTKNPNLSINNSLLKSYVFALKKIKGEYQIKNDIAMDTLINLPGVLSLGENRIPAGRIWPGLKKLLMKALDDFMQMRQQEGRATQGYFRNRAELLCASLKEIEARFRKVIKDKLKALNTDEERSAFLKNTDITEEIERLDFHVKNFNNKISKAGPIGKELDFIAQEMQREANTLGAKSCDALISVKVIQIKSQIEKIREQVQNIE